MPIYEYECDNCGVFEQLRSMQEASLKCACPVCENVSPRVMSVPQVRLVSPLVRMANDRNEKSRHAPHVCSSSCGHRHTTEKSQATKAGAKPKRQVYSGARPWVIEHR